MFQTDKDVQEIRKDCRVNWRMSDPTPGCSTYGDVDDQESCKFIQSD